MLPDIPVSIIFYGLVLLIAILAVVLLGISWSMQKLAERYYHLKEKRTAATQALKHANEVLAAARTDAAKIVRDASHLSRDFTSQFDRDLREVREENSKKLEGLMQEMRGRTITEIQSVSEYIKRRIEKELTEASEVLNQEVIKAQEQIQKDVAEYKNSRMTTIDSEVKSAVDEAAQRVLGGSIEPSRHEELAQKAIEDAKRQIL